MMLNALKFITFYIHFVGYVLKLEIRRNILRNGDLLMAISFGGKSWLFNC